VGQFQAREPSHFAVSAASPENGRFQVIMRFWAIPGLGRPWILRQHIVSMRVYLGKDSYIDAATIYTMYPEVERWLETKAKYDPQGVFTSNLGQRVRLA
jgi:hypothetical protein